MCVCVCVCKINLKVLCNSHFRPWAQSQKNDYHYTPTLPSHSQQTMRGNKCCHTHTHTHTHKYTIGCSARNDRNKKDGFPPKRQYEGDVLKVHLKFLAAFHFISECLGLAPLKAEGNKSSCCSCRDPYKNK